jgi:hypothetical protein
MFLTKTGNTGELVCAESDDYMFQQFCLKQLLGFSVFYWYSSLFICEKVRRKEICSEL